jgi:CRISPR-associated endonuclease/helicase Cas3
MVVDLTKYKSHPHKELTVHTQGVLAKTLALVKGFHCHKIAEICAIFHDLGKMNPNFQDKFSFHKKAEGYGHHAYLSAYGFFCFIKENKTYLQKELGEDWQNKLISIVAIIAKHHGNLPNFDLILNPDECNNLFEFLNNNIDIPSTNFIQYFIPNIDEFYLSKEANIQKNFKEKISYKSSSKNLANFLDTQFAFASLIQSDKIDAGDLELEKDREKVGKFCGAYSYKLNDYLQTLQTSSELNKLRTQIRIEATHNIQELLKTTTSRVFSLTAPTGAGKTLMLLSLAKEIIQSKKQDFRIIYAIPFLSITEQVEKECIKIFGEDWISRIDSKSENTEFNKLQEEVEVNPEKVKDIISVKFVEDSFLAPFIVTTFVRFFETLVSNVNSTLLKLPSFSNCIFLIDEIQSLPPRLYTFFVAYLSEFCERFDSYCIVSTATMPHFKIHDKEGMKLFSKYQEPIEVSSLKYFEHELFNRYKIAQNKQDINIDQLAKFILEENSSALIILNTIDDTKDLFNKLSKDLNNDELLLLNTHFTPNDRKYKIDLAKLRLQHKKKIILVSTQLIEAGVDIDFPVVYRDMATIPSIIQSAGRCNRNGKLDIGKVVVFNLRNRDNIRAELIYRYPDDKLLKDTRKVINLEYYEENELFKAQKSFFEIINKELVFGDVNQKKPEAKFLFVEKINELAFETIGKFRLIDEDIYGEELKYYIPTDEKDSNFQILKKLDQEFKDLCNLPKNQKDFKKIMSAKYSVESHLKKMSNQIIQIRLKKSDVKPLFFDNYGDLYLLNISDYNDITGIILNAQNQTI